MTDSTTQTNGAVQTVTAVQTEPVHQTNSDTQTDAVCQADTAAEADPAHDPLPEPVNPVPEPVHDPVPEPSNSIAHPSPPFPMPTSHPPSGPAGPPARHPDFLSIRGGRLQVADEVHQMTTMRFYDSLPGIPEPADPQGIRFIIPWGTPMEDFAIDVSFPPLTLLLVLLKCCLVLESSVVCDPAWLT